MKTCFLFPGQGAQYPGMARDLWESSAAAKEVFETASDALKMDTKKLLFESSAEDLKATDKTQVAMTIACLCSSAVVKEKGITPAACAGFSLGEFAALCESGVLSVADVLAIVRIRGELMEKASRNLDASDGAPGMAAVLGLPAQQVVAALGPLASEGVFPANYNSPSQVVVSGTARGLAVAEKELKAAGAKRLVRLQVSGPFHSPLLREARAEFDQALAAFRFSDPVVPVYSNVTGGRITRGDEARRLCGEQLVSMVRWVEVQEGLLGLGCDRFLETGPGTVLTGLMRALRPEARCSPAGTVEAIAKALEAAQVAGEPAIDAARGLAASDMKLTGKKAIVTGGSRGIGNAIVREFAARGASVWSLSRTPAENQAELEATAREAGGAVTWRAADVTRDDELARIVDAVIAEAGTLDVLVNNAGITRDGLIFRMSTADWEEVIRANLTSAFVASRAAARVMIRQRSGCILSVSSVSGIMGNPGQVNYSASKAGLIGFSKSLAREVASRGVRVNVIAPGFIETDMTKALGEKARGALIGQIPVGRAGTAVDVAALAAFLASDAAAYITGQVIAVDGGLSM